MTDGMHEAEPQSSVREAEPSERVNGPYFFEEYQKNRDKQRKKCSFHFLVPVYMKFKNESMKLKDAYMKLKTEYMTLKDE
jgi:hypothetical protein